MELRDYKRQFQDFLDQTDSSRRECERDRDWLDHKQWTDQEIAVLKKRKQRPIVVNKIKKKHNMLRGLEIKGRMDPKAYPRTPQHEQDADAITDALRYVADNSNLDKVISEAFDEYVCEGQEAAIVEINGKKDIQVRRIPWDRFYYDPHSRELDFSDARYMGITVWMDRDDLVSLFPDKKKQIKEIGETSGTDESQEDRPRWFDRQSNKRTRVRLNEHYFLEGGEWKLIYFVGDQEMTKADTSPFNDCDGAPTCPIEAESCYVDRQNNRYGVIRGDISLQEEINKTRTKSVHLLGTRTVIRQKGLVDSGTRLMDQLRSGEADIELNGEGRFDIDSHPELSQGAIAMYQDAKAELDDSVVNSANTDQGESGRSKLVDRENDIDELASVFDGHSAFKLRIYRQIWSRIKQFWTEERWVRVTDDSDGVKFVGLNRSITGRDIIADRFGVQVGDVESMLVQEGISLMPGQLDRVVGVENEVSKIDVDIIIRDTPDVVTIQQEQFQVIAELAKVYQNEVPFEVILQLSTLPNKDELIKQLKGDDEQQKAAQQQASELQQMATQLQLADQRATIMDKTMSAQKKEAEIQQTQVETQLALTGAEKIG